ncbi:VOC family protein [Streptomyces sp. G1]|uniref:VOC family protein n=1 Tax=Streptomyces sp. G1 TaxID=361572 RepID=UPI00202FC5C9|nr:VOC family protein [Streptomyces sp. G1]MCM1969904.1 VOC family protein [Streptomyces sp. G1]
MAENRASRYAEGVPCWVDVQLPDVEAGKRFYGDLFGWSFEDSYALKEGERVAALLPKTDGRMPTVWTVYFATPDAEALARRVLEAGGNIVAAPLQTRSGEAVTALVTDPEGAVFGLWQPLAHPGFGRRHEIGTFAWAQLYARDTETANDFYGPLFHAALFGPDAKPDFGRAPVADVFFPEMPPHFVVHFRVADCARAVERVTGLGGRVQAPPFETSYGTVAVVTDNQGASFALLQRPD